MLLSLAAAGHAIVVSTHDLLEAEHCASLLLYDQGIAYTQLPPAEFMLQTNSSSLDAAIIALAGPA
jgi:ABC-2 type transport system ATP-binding protein